MDTTLLMIFASLLIFVAILMGKVGAKFGIPTLLLFLFTGMLFGTDGLGYDFQNDHLVQKIGMVALSIILFTGGMDTQIAVIKKVALPGILLSTVGVLLTTLFTGFFIYYYSGSSFLSLAFSFPFSLLLAATMSSTDSASVFGILRSQRIHLKENLKPMLELESGSNDPMAYMLTIILIDYLLQGNISVAYLFKSFLLQFILGAFLGWLFGKLATLIINKANIPNTTLYPILLLSIVFFSFGVSQWLGGNAYLTAYIAGLTVGNLHIVHRGIINRFFDGITWLLQIILFILLGLLVNPAEMIRLAPLSIPVGLFIMFVARPLACFMSLSFVRKLSLKARFFVSWVGLRGAAPILFATYPVVRHVMEGSIIFNVVFFVTLFSLLIQGMTITPFAKRLRLATPAPPEGSFVGVELPEETGANMEERKVTAEMLKSGARMKNLQLTEKELVILIRRKNRFIVPKGHLLLHEGDILLVVSQVESGDSPKDETNLFNSIRSKIYKT